MEENAKLDVDDGPKMQREEADAEPSPPQAPEIAIDEVSLPAKPPVSDCDGPCR